MPADERSTLRLTLRRVTMADLDAFVDLETELRRGENPPRHPPDRTVWTGYLEQFVAVWGNGEQGYWAAEYAGQVAGFGGVKPKGWRGRECWNLYYRFFPRYMGLGLATELSREAVAVAAQDRSDWPVLVETRPSNAAAIAVAEHAGLTRRPELDDDGWAVLLLER